MKKVISNNWKWCGHQQAGQWVQRAAEGHGAVMRGLSERVAWKIHLQYEEESVVLQEGLGEDILGRGNCKSKDPEVAACMTGLRSPRGQCGWCKVCQRQQEKRAEVVTTQPCQPEAGSGVLI